MYKETHEFKLLSGPLCIIKRMDGSAQELLSKQGNLEQKTDDFNELLASCIISIGSKTSISKKDIERLLVMDRKLVLVELRQFTLSNPKLFTFTYTWTLANKTKLKEQINWDLETMFDKKHYHKVNEEAEIVPMDFADYEDVIQAKVFEVVLPMSGKTVRMEMPDFAQIMKWQKVDSKTISSHSEIMMRKPVVIEVKDDKEFPISVDLNSLPYLDVEELRSAIYQMEGTIDTTIVLDCEKQIGLKANLDLTNESSFFFPSRAI